MPQKGVAKLKRKADTLFSKYIRSRDGKCQKCGKVDNLQCAHLIGRRNLRLRYDPWNAITLCVGCHIYWAHKEVLDFAEWLEEKFPKNVAYVRKHKNEVERMRYEDYELIIVNLKKLLDSL